MTDETKQPLDYYQEPWTKKFLNGPGPLILILGLIVIGAYFGSRKDTVEVVKYEMPRNLICQPIRSHVEHTSFLNQLDENGYVPVMSGQLAFTERLSQMDKQKLKPITLFVCQDKFHSTKTVEAVTYFWGGK